MSRKFLLHKHSNLSKSSQQKATWLLQTTSKHLTASLSTLQHLLSTLHQHLLNININININIFSRLRHLLNTAKMTWCCIFPYNIFSSRARRAYKWEKAERKQNRGNRSPKLQRQREAVRDPSSSMDYAWKNKNSSMASSWRVPPEYRPTPVVAKTQYAQYSDISCRYPNPPVNSPASSMASKKKLKRAPTATEAHRDQRTQQWLHAPAVAYDRMSGSFNDALEYDRWVASRNKQLKWCEIPRTY